ncbi:SUF system NifU family Fe-S cluster assembly protein [Gammaproteobacteria bacterium]|nr:SUF system NifU family Fe-S cluster assembly protein [Gammaproteobacteria bacterium]
MNSGDELRELYRELILDHARNPRHFGKLEDATHSAEGINPLCGDKLKLYLRLDAGHRIEDAAFEGSGCAISVASASLLTDTVIGLDVPGAMSYFTAITRRMTDVESTEEVLDLDKLLALEGVREFPSRIKCATLAWHALKSALLSHTSPVTTE